MVITQQWSRIEKEAGRQPKPWPLIAKDTLGPGDWDERIARGVQESMKSTCSPRLLPRPPTAMPGFSTSSSAMCGSVPVSRVANAGSSLSHASQSMTRQCPCGRTLVLHCTLVISRKKKWTRSSCSSRPTTGLPKVKHWSSQSRPLGHLDRPGRSRPEAGDKAWWDRYLVGQPWPRMTRVPAKTRPRRPGGP